MQRHLWSILLSGLALCTLVSASMAGDHGFGWDYKYLPGAACQPQIGAQAGDFERSLHSILNVSQDRGERTVICPIVRDSAKPADLDIGVTVTKGVQCTFASLSRSGNEIASFAPTSTEAVDVDREIQYFSILPATVTELDGYYALQCTLPHEMEVFRFGAGERTDSTDYGN